MQVDVVGPLLLNASLLLVLTTDYIDWLVQVTELIDIIDNDRVFCVLTILWLIIHLLTLRNVTFRNVYAHCWHRWFA